MLSSSIYREHKCSTSQHSAISPAQCSETSACRSERDNASKQTELARAERQHVVGTMRSPRFRFLVRLVQHIYDDMYLDSYVRHADFTFLFERSEFLIDTSQKKSLRVCTRARVFDFSWF